MFSNIYAQKKIIFTKNEQTILILAKYNHEYTKEINLISTRRFSTISLSDRPHQWPSSSGRQEVPGSIPGRPCRPNRSEFSVVFSETRVNTGQDPLERPSLRASHSLAWVPRETIGHKPYNRPTKSSPVYPVKVVCACILTCIRTHRSSPNRRQFFRFLPKHCQIWIQNVTLKNKKMFLNNKPSYLCALFRNVSLFTRRTDG